MHFNLRFGYLADPANNLGTHLGTHEEKEEKGLQPFDHNPLILMEPPIGIEPTTY